MASLVNRKGIYYAVFSFRSKKRWIKIGDVSNKEATKIIKKLELELIKDRLNILEINPPLFYEFLDNYLDYALTNKADRTVKREHSVIKNLKSFFGNIELKRIDSYRIDSIRLL